MKNWQTTLAGLLVGLTGSAAIGWQKPDGSVNWFAVALAVASALLGLVAKQHNVTGGTVGVTAEAQTRTGEPETLVTQPGVPVPPPSRPVAPPKED